jgi:2-polyprenyl-6-methoxyphenol hydroxylase-like FAD-dependent oxidoreductase
MNNIVHPELCHVAARITNDGLWRVSYQEDKNMTYQEVVDNQPAKFERILPGHPKPEDYTLTSINPYKMHQRCADRLRVGRICIAADAAHLCNPWGGLGLTGGFADVMGLAECLEGISSGQADDGILDKYDEVRRSIYHSVIDPISTLNFYRVSTSDPDTVKDDPVLSLWAAAKDDPKLKENLEKVLLLLSALVYRYTNLL